MRSTPLQLDFRRRPVSPWRWLGWVLLAAAAAVAVVFSQGYAEVAQRHAASQSRSERLNERLRAANPNRTVVAVDPQALASLKRANAIIDQLTVPWDELFDAFEAADARDLGVLSLTPNVRDRTVRLAGEARSMGELLSYVDRVAMQPALSQVHLLGYNTVQREAASTLSFTLAATWRPLP
jgi:hypothetical protein